MNMSLPDTMVVPYSSYAALWDGEPPFDDLEHWLRVNVWSAHRSLLRRVKGAQMDYYRRTGFGPVNLASVGVCR